MTCSLSSARKKMVGFGFLMPCDKDIFTARQLADIQQGKLKIHELVWHHHEVSGKMELVSSAFHTVPHIGGRILWGHKEQPVEPQYSDETVSFIDSNDEVPIASVREIE